jgi:FkbM family methyltransferase
VVAFEPNPATLKALERVAAGDDRLTVEQCAVGDREGEAILHADGNSATGSVLPYAHGYRTQGAVSRTRVAMVALDAYRSRRLQGRAVGVLKVDTQGHDLAVLKGAACLLRDDRPLVLAEMIYVPMYEGQGDPCDMFIYLRGAGYRFYGAFNIHVTVEGRLAFADGLFVPPGLDVPHSHEYVQIDDHDAQREQIRVLEGICRERLDVINLLDAEVKRLAR